MSRAKKMLPIPKGSLLMVSTGEHSDYCVRGVFISMRDIDAEALRLEWLDIHPEQNKKLRFDDGRFLGWVARRGFIEALDNYEWHVSSSGSPDEMTVCQADVMCEECGHQQAVPRSTRHRAIE